MGQQLNDPPASYAFIAIRFGLYGVIFAAVMGMSGGGPGGRDGMSKMFNIGKAKPAVSKDAKVKVCYFSTRYLKEIMQVFVDYLLIPHLTQTLLPTTGLLQRCCRLRRS